MNQRMRSILIVAIVAGVMASGALVVLAWNAILHPCGPGFEAHEGLVPVSSKVNSPTNMTLEIQNVGTLETTLVSYTVKDVSGDSYSQSFNPQPVLCGNVEYTATIILAGQVTGQPFTFQHGNSYAILIDTAHSQFTFTITA